MENKKTGSEPNVISALKNIFKKESVLFLLVAVLQVIVFAPLIYQHRMVIAHDGLQYFCLQYFFLNNMVASGEIPQWIPFMTHGTVASWWYTVQAGIFQNVLLLIRHIPQTVDFLTLFNISMFVDEFLLLIGVWLLGKRFYRSSFSVFFVTVAAMGSCIWLAQPWFNLHLYYAVPLILYYFHVFLDKGQWRYFLLGGSLLTIQNMGSLPYFLAITSMVVFSYFLFYLLFNFSYVKRRIRSLQYKWPFWISMLLFGFFLFFAYKVLTIGVEQLRIDNLDREKDLLTSLSDFLNYGGNLGLKKWLEVFLGVSPALDYTLYIGLLPISFIILGFKSLFQKENRHFTLTALFCLLFSMGTLVSVIFYYTWPMMKFFRHLSLIAPMTKLFLCFLAGFSLESVITKYTSKTGRSTVSKNFLPMMISLSLLAFSLFLFFLSRQDMLLWKIIDGMITRLGHFGIPRLALVFNSEVLNTLISRTGFFALMSSIVFGLLPFLTHKKWRGPILVFLLCCHVLDAYSYKIFEMNILSSPLDKRWQAITQFTDVPYTKRRIQHSDAENLRESILKHLPFSNGEVYWSHNAFSFKDEINSSLRTDHWLIPLDNYMNAYRGQPLGERWIFRHGKLEFPLTHPAAGKIAGVTEDKIQFFSNAYIINDETALASRITDEKYTGDILFLSPSGPEDEGEPAINEWQSEYDLSKGMRMRLPYEVTRFDANNLQVVVTNPSKQDIWMLYSDVWHPFWRAKVNGKAVTVRRANLAYKAVPLKEGRNKVSFYFKSAMMSFFHFYFGVASLVWMGVMLWLTSQIIFDRRERKD